MKNYLVDFSTKTITLTKSFSKLASNPTTDEFKVLSTLRSGYPDFTIKLKTTDTKGDTLTLKAIENAVQASGNASLIKEFETLRNAKATSKNGKTVNKHSFFAIKKWFRKNFN